MDKQVTVSSGVARICCEEGHGCSSCSVTNSFVPNAANAVG